MGGIQPHEVKLPPFVIDNELSCRLSMQLPDNLCITSERIIFDWSDVCFFNDYTLLKLILMQTHLRAQGNRVSNKGFRSAFLDQNRQAVLRQLWAVGLPELTASGHLIRSEQLKATLEDEAELLESDPLYRLTSPATITAVVPMLFSHDRRHFSPGSREEKQLDSFIKFCLCPLREKPSAWDLIESRDFRHNMLQQLRRNVQEHSHPVDALAIGLAIVRVWTSRSLYDEWGLTEQAKAELFRAWGKEPVPELLQNLDSGSGIIQISVIDNGQGIPETLEKVHKQLIAESGQREFFRLRYSDSDFDKRFAEPASWSDEKARLIAFAMDELGTSKRDRALEIKGLQHLREDIVIPVRGALVIESDGASVGYIMHDKPYGQPLQIPLKWCQTGGTGVSLAVPMRPVDAEVSTKKWVRNFGISSDTGTNAERIKILDHLSNRLTIGILSEPTPSDFKACAQAVLNKIQLSEHEDNVRSLRQKKLLIVDWGELPDSKRIFHFLLVEIAKGLAITDQRRMRPFVFASLPKGLCGLLGRAIGRFSKLDNPTPIFAFTTEQIEPFWLGLDDDNIIPEELRSKVSCEIRRKLTDQKENRTEAFFRDCVTRLLDHPKPVSLSDTSILFGVRYENHTAIRESPAFSRLNLLVRRCPLFREEQQPSVEGEMTYTGRFRPVFSLEEIATEVRSLFLDQFRDVFTKPPVCFVPGGKNGVRLPHSKRVIARYFRSDALVDSSIAMELTEELTAIALGIARQMPGGRIDWVVSCTSPLHWFVHKIVDGLAEYGMICSHHVFQSYETIPDSIEEIDIHSGEIVLVFTDVISSGQTAYRMADSIVNHFGVTKVKIAGLIALADIRTAIDRESGPDLDKIYGGTIVCLYNEPEPHRDDLTPTYYVHPETVVPTRYAADNPLEEFFDKNYTGNGPLIENHAYFSSAKRTLDLMQSLSAIRFGHFQHGSHHSEIFIDVEKILGNRDFRNIMVTALFRYIVTHDIRLVLYPSHSSAYMLADDLKQRFSTSELSVEFIMACRTFKGTRGTSYALTQFSPHPNLQWKRFSNNAVLILDDAACSGETVESIIAELARVDSKYYEGQQLSTPNLPESRFLIHVVAFLNRLPRVTRDFWGGLSKIIEGRLHFSTFIRIPLAADSAELCPQCRLERKLRYERDSKLYCLYAKEFFEWWISHNKVVLSHERQLSGNQSGSRFSSNDTLRLAGYLSAIERHSYLAICDRLFEKEGMPAEEKSRAVRVLIRSRAAFLYGMLPFASVDKPRDVTGKLCEELMSLINIVLDKNGNLLSQEDALQILQVLTIRYLTRRRSKEEIEGVMECLLRKFAPLFENRLIVGGIACVLDSYLKSLLPSENKDIRNQIRKKLSTIAKSNLPSRASLIIDWFDAYLAEEGNRISSVGDAVKLLAAFAKKGRRSHFYGRHELDELRDIFQRPPKEASADETESVRRALVYTDRFLELVGATRALQSASMMDESELRCLQNETVSDVQELRRLCNNFLRGENQIEALKNYQAVKFLYQRMYERWFPELMIERPKAAVVIDYFTPNLSDHLLSAWKSYSPQRRTKEVIHMDMSDLSRCRSTKVLIDPTVLSTAMHQILDNVDKFAEKDASVSVLCHLRLPEDGLNAEEATTKIGSGRVGVVVSNTNTSRPEPTQIKLRGLSGVKNRLFEYDGDLDYNVPEKDYSFQVTMILNIWTEEE